jgi:hypothetical protein
VEGVDLVPQQLTAATLPQMGGPGQPVGLLGSDVLGRFGAVRVDFAAGGLVFPGPEGAPIGHPSPPPGAAGPVAASLTGGRGIAVPLLVDTSPGDVSLGVVVRFAGGPRRTFVVDTGTSQTVVSASLARAQKLEGTELAQRQATVCSVVTVPLVRSGMWTVPGVPLAPQLVGATRFGTLGATQGLLGSDVLRTFGWVVLDYQRAQMVIGSAPRSGGNPPDGR